MRVRLTDWWRRRRRGHPRVDEVCFYASQAELPEDLPRHQLAVVGTPESPKWLILECPCGNGHQLRVNLSHGRAPWWELDLDGAPSVRPSIDLREEPLRRCHFWIASGRVTWSPDAFARSGRSRRRDRPR